jgi:pimeloyl-ACP methyl ester carboxylesterase
LHDEALIALPQLLEQLGIERPILVGHSDGGSIALIHAGAGIRPVAAVVTLAAHVLVEDISVENIAAAKIAYETTNMRAKLARYHADADSVFRGWNRIWLDPEFRAWNIEEYLPRIACPVLAIQGADDEYGTMEQMRRIGAQVRDVELLKLEDCRHSVHKDQPEAVLALSPGSSTGFRRNLRARSAHEFARAVRRGSHRPRIWREQIRDAIGYCCRGRKIATSQSRLR